MTRNELIVAIRLKLTELELGLKKAREDFNRFGTTTARELNQADEKAQNLTETLLSMGKNLVGFMALGAAMRSMGRALSGAVNAGSEFTATMSEVSAISRASGISLSRLERDALRLGSSTRYTASDVARLQVNLSKLGFTPDQILASTEGILALATATGEDLASSAEVAGGVLRAFHYQADQTHRVADVMARSFSASALNLQKFTVGMSQAGPVSKSAGLEIEDTTAILGALVNQNIRAETAGTGLRNILLKLNESGSKLAEMLGGNIHSFDDLLDRLAKAGKDAALFKAAQKEVGLENAVVFESLVKNTAALKDLRATLRDAQGSATEMATVMETNFKGAVTELSSALEGFGIALFDTFGDALGSAVEGVTGLIQGMTRLIGSQKDEAAQARILFAALKDTTASEATRARALKQINEAYGDLLPNMLDEHSSLEDVEAAQKAVTAAILERIALRVNEEKITKLMQEKARLMDAEPALIDRQTQAAREYTAALMNQGQAAGVLPEYLKQTTGEMERMTVAGDDMILMASSVAGATEAAGTRTEALAAKSRNAEEALKKNRDRQAEIKAEMEKLTAAAGKLAKEFTSLGNAATDSSGATEAAAETFQSAGTALEAREFELSLRRKRLAGATEQDILQMRIDRAKAEYEAAEEGSRRQYEAKLRWEEAELALDEYTAERKAAAQNRFAARLTAIKKRMAAVSQSIAEKGMVQTGKNIVMDSISAGVSAVKQAANIQFPANLVAVPVALAAVYAALRSVKSTAKSLVGFKSGGLIDRPTLALIGEEVRTSGPEIVAPEKTFVRYMREEVTPRIVADIHTKVTPETPETKEVIARLDQLIARTPAFTPDELADALLDGMEGRL